MHIVGGLDLSLGCGTQIDSNQLVHYKQTLQMEGRIFFKPTGKFEKIENLIQSRNVIASPVRKGLKKAVPDGSKEEQDENQRMRNELRALLSRPRVERICARSIGEWDSERKAVRLIRKEGKFQGFGYTVDKVEYLTNYEALFLLELNRLEIYFNFVLVSVEQAYHLLLGQGKSREYDKYLIYSTLSRTGYIVQKFTNQPNRPAATVAQTCDEVDCVWEILQSRLDKNYEIPTYVRNFERFEAINTSMASIIERTKSASIADSACDSSETPVLPPGKRKANSNGEHHCNAKRWKCDYTVRREQLGSFLDCLKDEREYIRFREMFGKLELVELKAFDDFDDENSRDFTIDFDLHLPSASFRKSGNDLPSCRVVVLGPEDKFPNRSELVKAFKSQVVTVPLLITYVSLSKHIQAFLYYYT